MRGKGMVILGFLIVGSLLVTILLPIESHAPNVILSAYGTAKVDGVISKGEYGSCIGSIEQGKYKFTICETNDDTNIYLAVQINDLTKDESDEVVFAFDNRHDGIFTDCSISMEDYLHLNSNSDFMDSNGCYDEKAIDFGVYGYSGGVKRGIKELIGESNNDGSGTVKFTPESGYVYEMSHPLKTGDAEDFSLSSKSTVGFCFSYCDGNLYGYGDIKTFEDSFPPKCNQYTTFGLILPEGGKFWFVNVLLPERFSAIYNGSTSDFGDIKILASSMVTTAPATETEKKPAAGLTNSSFLIIVILLPIGYLRKQRRMR